MLKKQGCLLLWENKKDLEIVSAAPKMVSFFTADSWKKDTIFGAAETSFRPSLFWQGVSGEISSRAGGRSEKNVLGLTYPPPPLVWIGLADERQL